MNKFLTKVAEFFTHTTGDSGLEKILESGRIKHIGHLAKENPDLEVSVEHLPVPFLRKTMRAEDALKTMDGVKVIDKVFLARNGYLPNYGDNVIVKDLVIPTVRPSFNSIPEEHVTSRSLSVRNNAKVYVPDERLADWKSKYQGVSFRPKSELHLKAYTFTDRAAAYPGKLLSALGISKQANHPVAPRHVGSTAFVGGSTGLGLNVDDSDVDIFAPYARNGHYLRAIERIKAKHPELVERKSTLNNGFKTTLTGVINGKDVDVVLGTGDKAIKYRDAYKAALSSLTDEQRESIKKRKLELKNSWFFPETRYKMYKNQLSEQLGLKQHYF